MGPILTIAKRDLKGYFATPKGVAIFWFFLLFMGVFFFSFVNMFAQMQQQAQGAGQSATLEQLLKALFYNLHFILLLVIPALTMSSFAEEKRSQSLRLLTTAPISSLQIVLGKFIGVAALMGLVLLASSVYPLFTMLYGNPDKGPVLVSYLGLFLLICSQLAFGLWISSMTSNQLMAFLFTMFGLFLLLILSWIAPNISAGGWAEDLFRYIASTTHLDNFFKGVISVGSVTYFILFTALFLFFTNAVLDSERWR